LLLFVKKLTVIGNIEKIQGVTNATKPEINPVIKMPHKDGFSSLPFFEVLSSSDELGAMAL
jgi:hypothetical protein